MCGRFTQTKTREEVLEQLAEIELPPLFHRRYNVAPTQKVAIIRQQTPNRAEECIWGFKNPHSGTPVINARVETLSERPMFKSLIHSNRCLIPADGFYEWKGKQPYYFQPLERQLFAFAGLWQNDRCVIITRAADQNMHGLHDRMPVILPSSHWKSWLIDFKYSAPPELTTRPVSPLVNNVSNDRPECLSSIGIQSDLFE